MPIREYECKCGEITEQLFHNTEDVPDYVDCEMCGKRAMLRQISAPAMFKVWDYSPEAWDTDANVSRKKAGVPLL